MYNDMRRVMGREVTLRSCLQNIFLEGAGMVR